MKTLKFFTASLSMALLPVIVSAQNAPLARIDNANGLIKRLVTLGNAAIYVLISLAVVFIIFKVVMYFIKGKDGEGRGEAGMQILWGIVGLAIILSIWGLVNILVNTFKTDTNTPTDKFPTADFVSKP